MDKYVAAMYTAVSFADVLQYFVFLLLAVLTDMMSQF